MQILPDASNSEIWTLGLVDGLPEKNSGETIERNNNCLLKRKGKPKTQR